MASLDFNYHASRAQQARFGRMLSGAAAKLLPWLAGMLWLFGVVLLLFERLPVGWLVCALGCTVSITAVFYEWHVKKLPAGKDDDMTSLLAGDVLGRLPARPTPADVAKAVGEVPSGQFMGARLGLTPSLLNSMASSDPNAIRDLVNQDRKRVV